MAHGIDLVSASSAMHFLYEENHSFKSAALEILNDNAELIWPELTDCVNELLILSDDPSFQDNELASLLLSKMYYHNELYSRSLKYALQAGNHFKFNSQGQFEATIMSKWIEAYIVLWRNDYTNRQKRERVEASPGIQALNNFQDDGLIRSSFAAKSALFNDVRQFHADYSIIDTTEIIELLVDAASRERIEEGMKTIFKIAYQAGGKNYKFVLGVAIEARDIKVIRETINHARESGSNVAEELVEYLLDICMNLVEERALRDELLTVLVDFLNKSSKKDFFSIAKCVVHLGDYKSSAEMLKTLVEKGDPKSFAIAYQISFDLYENGTQEFLRNLSELIPVPEEPEAAEPVEGEAGASASAEAIDKKERPEPSPKEHAYQLIRQIINGDKSTELTLEFLDRANKADEAVINRVRQTLDLRLSVFYAGFSLCNAYMNAGTTNDAIYRGDIEWVRKGLFWSRFTSVAALGAIHRGNTKNALTLLGRYLEQPRDEDYSYPYYRGGALYALGLIYSNNGGEIVDFLTEEIEKPKIPDQFKSEAESNPQFVETLTHGAALGLGLAGMASGSSELVETLEAVMNNDSAICGDAAVLAIGLVILGSGNQEVVGRLIETATVTEHEKIVRGISMAVALIMYGRNEGADFVINQLLQSSDANIRYGGVLTISMAYCGSGSNSVIQKLLRLAITDVNDDVRRVAVTSLGFVLLKKPDSVPRVVELFADSYNAHVRYGAAMALGVACAGTGSAEAVDLLESMLKDSVDFVRQGAFVALGMILIQQNDVSNPKVAAVRKACHKIIGDRREDVLPKFGCTIALGILDAGGRNCTIGLQTPTGNLNMRGIVGMMVFTQHWYWFPYAHFLSLSFTPTALIAVNNKLEVPELSYHCAAKQSVFDYPPPIKVKAEEETETYRAAILSMTARAHKRQQAKKRRVVPEAKKGEEEAKAVAGDSMDVDEPEKKPRAARPEKEKVGFEVSNMSRVLPSQVQYISLAKARYEPVRKLTGGIVVVHDTQPEEEEKLIELKAGSRTATAIVRSNAGQDMHLGARLSSMGQDGLMYNFERLAGFERRDQTGPEEPEGEGEADEAEGEEEDTFEAAPLPGEFEYETDGEDDEMEVDE